MAAFNDPKYFQASNDPAFFTTYRPGTPAPRSGFYRCDNCGDEVACNKGQPLPPQNYHQHRNYLMPMIWRLIAIAKQVA